MSEIITTDRTNAIIQTVIDGVTSQHTKRAYGRAISDFMAWFQTTGQVELNKAAVNAYRAYLEAQGIGASSINQRLSAIRKLAVEAADNGALPEQKANGIKAVKGVRQEGTRAGNWLTRDQAQELINTPDTSTAKGLRDRAILATLIGCGLRRAECAALTFAHIQQRDGRWVIIDLVGKRGRVRSVPMPAWCKAAVDAWSFAAGIASGAVFRSVRRGGHLDGETMTDQAIADVVRHHSAAAGLSVAAHDLRRTFAKLAHKGGAGLDQIQLSLGHSSIQTTERYLGVSQDLQDAPCDHLGIKLQ